MPVAAGTFPSAAATARTGGEVPLHVVTMGIATILEARHCLLVAHGEAKAHAGVSRAVEALRGI